MWHLWHALHTLHSRHHTGHFAAGDHLHHLPGLVELLDESVHLLIAGARALGDALTAAGIENLRIGSFLRGHALDDGLNALEGVVVDVDIADGLAHTRNHAGEVLEVTHLLYLLYLIVKIVEVELVLLNFLLELACLLLVELLLGALHERR